MAAYGSNLQTGPEVRIIDSHHHLWKYNHQDYVWMDDTMSLLMRDYLPEDLEGELKATGVEGTVVVQARQQLEETRWLLELADKYSFIKGVVGWLDLRSSDLVNQLRVFADHPKMVGVRHVIHDEKDDDFMLHSEFKTGMVYLGAYNLCYDLLLFPRHIERASRLVKSFPRQRFILDHLGKPLIKAGEMDPWKQDLARLAMYPNVWCKLSGMVTEADLKNWSYEDLLPFMETVLELFGAERIMVGSDWPVCRLAGEYARVMKIVPEFIASLSRKEQEQILFKNAIDCYQLNCDINGETKN
jgi:L-fuconolactonase